MITSGITHENGLHVRIHTTGDRHIDRFAGLEGRIVEMRNINDGGYHYTQVCVAFDDGRQIWVNSDEVTVL